eukprot:PITA_26452
MYQALVAQVEEPSSFQEDIQHQVWVDTMVEEYSSIMMDDVWEVVARPKDKSVVGLRIQHDGYGVDALVSRVGSLAEEWGDLPWAKKICYGDSEEIQNARLLAHGYAYDHQLEETRCIRRQGSGPTLYKQLIGWLMYLINTRLDICFDVNTLSQFMVEPKRVHWAAGRHILRYVCGIVGYGLKYTRGDAVRLRGFTDADWEGSSVDWKSTSEYCFNIGSGMTSWCNRKQKSITLSSIEVEYMAANTATCKVIWLRKFLVSLFRKRMEATIV